jgi:hypothetical protein
MAKEDQEEFALGVALTTYGLKAGIKKFEDKRKRKSKEKSGNENQ